MQTLRRTALAGTELERAQCGTIRLKLLKIGAQVRVTVRNIRISLTGGYPHAALLARVLAPSRRAAQLDRADAARPEPARRFHCLKYFP
jgi:hypothetical protein